MIRRLAAASAIALVAACAGQTPGELADQRALAEARPVGPAEDCVLIRTIRDTRVRDDRTIDFHLTDGRTLRNRLPASCPGLGFEEAFAYETSLSRLCSVDTIRVLRTGGGAAGASCGLGPFQPVALPDPL